jgi:hypothetical protein
MPHFEVVCLDCTVTVGKKLLLPDDNFNFIKKFPIYANTVLLFLWLYMPMAEVVILDCAAWLK